jgi:virginiamycin B lyase
MKVLLRPALAVLAFACAQSAAAQTTPQSCKYANRMASGQDVALVVAGDGALWYASQNANRIVRVDPKGSETPFIPVDGSTKGLSGMLLDGKGNVWFSKRGGGVGLIGRFPEAGGEGVEFALPEKHAFPDGVVLGPDGKVWYFDPVQHKIGRINEDGGVEAFEGPPRLNPGITPTDMAAGPDNSLWVTDLGENALFKFDLATRGWKRYDIPEPQAHPQHVRVGKDGTVWFSMTARNKLGRLKNGAFTSIDIANERPNGLHVAEDQSLWYTTTGSSLGRIKSDGTREKYTCRSVGHIATSKDGTVYALGGSTIQILKPGDTVSAPKVASTSNVQGPSMMPLGPSPLKEVSLPELRKLFDDKTKKLVVHYNVLPKKGCGPCDESLAVFEEFARKNAGKATFVRIANEYTEAAWSDPWYQANAALTGVPTYITYVDQREVARVVGRESVPVLESKLLPAK